MCVVHFKLWTNLNLNFSVIIKSAKNLSELSRIEAEFEPKQPVWACSLSRFYIYVHQPTDQDPIQIFHMPNAIAASLFSFLFRSPSTALQHKSKSATIISFMCWISTAMQRNRPTTDRKARFLAVDPAILCCGMTCLTPSECDECCPPMNVTNIIIIIFIFIIIFIIIIIISIFLYFFFFLLLLLLLSY